MLFLNDIQLKSFKQKDDFFKILEKDLKQVPNELIKKRIIKRFLTLPFFNEPSSLIFMPLLLSSKKGLLEETDYNEIILPFLKGCLLSKNRGLRIRLLQTIQYYQDSFKPQYLFNEVFNGLYDSNDDLVMCTMDAFVQMAKTSLRNDLEYLNKIILNLHKYSTSKLQNIAIRSHSLVSMVKLFSIQNIKKNIILSAIEKILFDENVELKLHGLNIILMNLHNFDPRELISVILKMILPLTLHEKSQVRLKTIRVINSILAHLDEIDLSKFNYGNVTSEIPLDFISNLKPEFPKESNQEILRKSEFLGSGPNISNVISVNEILSENNEKDLVKNIEENLSKELNEIKIENQKDLEKIEELEEENWDNWDEGEKKEVVKNEKKIVEKKEKKIKSLDEDEEEIVTSTEPDYFSQLGMVKKDEKRVKDLLNESEIQITDLPKWDE